MDGFAQTCEDVARFAKPARKAALLADYFKTLADDDFGRAVHLLCCGPVLDRDPQQAMFAEERPRKLSISSAVLRAACRNVSGWSDAVIARCYEESGDYGETISLLIGPHTRALPLSLARAEDLYTALATGDKIAILTEAFGSFRPLAIKYFIRAIRGNLRIGLDETIIEEAIAIATGAALVEVRRANNRSGDLRRAALAARRGTLAEIETRLFHPMRLIEPRRIEQLPKLEEYIVEEQYDGVRAQVHVENGRVAVYPRTREEFAELKRITGSAVLDGTIAGSTFIPHDILYRDGALLLDVPVEQRRAILDATWGGRSAGQPSGALLLKSRHSHYNPFAETWLLYQRPSITLNLAITTAAPGRGKYAMLLCEYTLGVRDGDTFVNVAKLQPTLPDDRLRELTRRLRAATLEKFGRVVLVKPDLILEVACDGIRKSTRHKGGYALRSPRVLGWLKDKSTADCDTLDRVRELAR